MNASEKLLHDTLVEIHRALPAMEAEAEAYPLNYRVGICCNVASLLDEKEYREEITWAELRDAERLLDKIMVRWPLRDISTDCYPVGGENEYYYSLRNKWKNPHRIQLLEWMIKELENGD